MMDSALLEWLRSHEFEDLSAILVDELGLEQFNDFYLLRDERDVREFIDDVTTLKPMSSRLQQQLKTEVLNIIEGKNQKPSRTPVTANSSISSISTSSSSASSSSAAPKSPSTGSNSRSLSESVGDHRVGEQPMTVKPIKAATAPISTPAEKRAHASATITKKIKTKTSSISSDSALLSSGNSTPQSKQAKEKPKIASTAAASKVEEKVKKPKSTSPPKPETKKPKSKLSKMTKQERNKSREGKEIHTNRRVRLDDGRIGVVRYKGRTAFGKSGEDWIGIEIEYGQGVHNGTKHGRKYFLCKDGKGVMVRPEKIIQDLGNPQTKPLDERMKKGSAEIQESMKQIAQEKLEQRRKQKQEAELEAAEKLHSNYNGDLEWKPAKFEDYSPDHSAGVFDEKLMHGKTLLDKHKNEKADKKKKIEEI